MPTNNKERLNITLNQDDVKSLHQLIKKLETDSDARYNYIDTIRKLIKFGNVYWDQIKEFN